MSHPSAPTTLSHLQSFRFERVINEDPLTHSLTLLGTFPASNSITIPPNIENRVRAIVRIEKTALNSASASTLFAPSPSGILGKVKLDGSTDIYHWLFGWLADLDVNDSQFAAGEERTVRDADVKISIVCPATEVHVKKYTKQQISMIRETPELYKKIVKPYIDSFPAERTQWVSNILLGHSEQSKILISKPSFLILPDMKWDGQTISSLYLLALVRDSSLRSLRDLRRKHVSLLKEIREDAERVVWEKWGSAAAAGRTGEGGIRNPKGELRMYVHYQPSYYHFHVHIVNANQVGMLGVAVGQAHLLDDIISLLEIEPENGPGIFERMTLTYGLGDQHGLFEAMREATMGGEGV